MRGWEGTEYVTSSLVIPLIYKTIRSLRPEATVTFPWRKGKAGESGTAGDFGTSAAEARVVGRSSTQSSNGSSGVVPCDAGVV